MGCVESLSTLLLHFNVFDFCTPTGDMGLGQVQMRATKKKESVKTAEREMALFSKPPSIAVEGKFDFHSWNI